MKNKLLNVLYQYIHNKPLADYKAITELINSINDDSVKDLNISVNDTGIYISMFDSEYKLISISFTDTNKMLFCLPDNVSKTYVIDSSPIWQDCRYNMQYNEIKALLS